MDRQRDGGSSIPVPSLVFKNSEAIHSTLSGTTGRPAGATGIERLTLPIASS